MMSQWKPPSSAVGINPRLSDLKGPGPIETAEIEECLY